MKNECPCRKQGHFIRCGRRCCNSKIRTAKKEKASLLLYLRFIIAGAFPVEKEEKR